MYNITKGNVVPMKATLVHEEERFPVAISTDISVRIYNEYRYIDAINIVVDGEEDGVIYFDIPDTLNSGTFGVEVKGKSKGYNWRTATDNVVKITRSTEKEEGSEAIPEGDTYDIVMTVQLYKQQSPQEAVDEHNNDEEAHPYILDKINEVEGKIPVLPDHIVTDENYVHTDNNYTNEEKEKLANLENYDDTEIKRDISLLAQVKVDKVPNKGLSTNDFTNEDKAKLNSALQTETDPTVPQWAKQPNKPSYTSQEVGALPNTTKYGSTIDLSMNSTTYVLTLSLKDQDGTVLNTKTVDLPIESVVVNGRYDATNKKIVLTLQSGSTIDVPVGDLVAGLQTEITSVNMLSADLVDDTNSAHKFVTAQEKQNWNNKSDFSGDYNDLANKPTIPTVPTNVSAFANDAGYLTEHQDISGKVDKEQGKGLSTNDYTTQEKNKLASLENYDDTQVRQLIAQTNANFANYYTKSESYSANEVDTLLRTQRQGQYVVVATLPTASADTMFKIYLVPSANPQTSNIKDEYLTLENNGSYYWEPIGTTAVDLSNYSTTAEMNAAIATALNNYYTKSEVNTALGNKQDTISDLNDIRSGASAGSTAYQKPNTGIPSTDMSQAVQTSLSKADTAVQPAAMSAALVDTVAESGVYDVTANNDNAKFASLSALLSSENLNTLIPLAKRKGGMSIKFVLTSDNKYVQFRYMGTSTAAADFTNTANWQGVDDEPTANSKNLITSGGVYDALQRENVVATAIANTGSVATAMVGIYDVNDVLIVEGEGEVTALIQYGKTYKVKCSRVYDYLTPTEQTFVASILSRHVTMQYTYIERDVVTFDQTISDSAEMLSGDIQGDVIKEIRSHSHLYLGTPTTQSGDTEGTELLCQLNDEDSRLYYDGTPAALDGSEGDQWLKLPVFWWKIVGVGEAAADGAHDQYRFMFAFTGEPDPSWNKWYGDRNLVGAKEMTVIKGKGRSVSGGQSTSNFTQAQGNAYAAARNLGCQQVTWEWQWIMCILCYAWNGDTNSQKTNGIGSSSTSRTLGVTDQLGMTDTTPAQATSLTSARFWGLEAWWNCKVEWMGNVVMENYVMRITDQDTKQTRQVSGFIQCDGTGGFNSRMRIDANGDFVPLAKAGTETTYYCDFVNSNTGSRVLSRSGNYSSVNGGVAVVYAIQDASIVNVGIGSRLAFNGVITEAESVAAYKAALA